MTNDILEKLKKHLGSTSKEKINKSWNDLNKYDNVGITFDEYLKINNIVL